MLEVKDLNVARGGLHVLWDVSIKVQKEEIVALIGSNGAGKTTLLSTIAGILKPLSGTILFNDREITGLPPHKIVKLGVSFVPEDRKLFTNCTVRENLLLGAYTSKEKRHTKSMLETVYQIFPLLKERENQLSATLSGGEQRMLAIARSLMSSPRLLILDEPSQGLSPKMTMEVLKTLKKLRDYGISVLLAEQNVHVALNIADRVYVMETGKVTLHGKSAELFGNEYIREAFLGI
ncbi:ABC transporter ATP-binding protein [Candidatus Bathyarchaeota archaeon]|nr:ABC transporter ATP-binding protein [Candidatus Bathyarchaeota archaeon]